MVFFQESGSAAQTSPPPLTWISVLRFISSPSKKQLKRMFLLNKTKQIKSPKRSLPSSALTATDGREVFQTLPQQLSPGNSSGVTVGAPAVPPVPSRPRGNTQDVGVLQPKWVKINSTENQEGTDFLSTSQRRVLLPPACPTAVIGG